MLNLDLENMRVTVDFDGGMIASFNVCKESTGALKIAYDSLKCKKLTAIIKPWRAKRSHDANSFLWSLCDKIAIVMRSSKEEVYRELVKRVGVFESISMRTDAVDSFRRMWGERGLGWFVEVIDDSMLQGYKSVFVYFGSSSYDSAQMSRLLDETIQEAESLGIPTLPDHDIKKIKEEWNAPKQTSEGS